MNVKSNFFMLSLFGLCLLLSSCEKDDANPGNAPETPAVLTKNGSESILTLGNVVYKTGYRQVSSNNQDAYLLKEVDGKQEWSKTYDTAPDDSRGVALNFADGRLYAAFTCTGGNTGFKATAGAFQSSYGSGGGPKITYFAQVNPDNGEIVAATFVGARLSDGRTNTFLPDDKVAQPITILASRQVRLQAIHAYDTGDGRLTPGSNDADCNKSGGKWTGVFNEKMALVSGDCQ